MEVAPANTPLSFEVTFDSDDLDVGMSVYDTTGVSPILVQGPSAMVNIVGNTYVGKFAAALGKSYLIFKAVYTDDTFTTLDNNYSQGSESIIAESSGSGGDCGPIVGLVTSDQVIGYVDNNNDIIGLVTC